MDQETRHSCEYENPSPIRNFILSLYFEGMKERDEVADERSTRLFMAYDVISFWNRDSDV